MKTKSITVNESRIENKKKLGYDVKSECLHTLWK